MAVVDITQRGLFDLWFDSRPINLVTVCNTCTFGS